MAVSNYANTIDSTEQYAVRAFADALEQIPMALAENSGLNSLKSISQSKSTQAETNEPFHGIDCMSKGSINMKEQKVFETLLSKKGQLQLATQVVKMILKIDDVIEPNGSNWFEYYKNFNNLNKNNYQLGIKIQRITCSYY